jgi:hypothetical protein
VNYKRKSRRRFFLLMRSRTPLISSAFRGGGLDPPQPYPPGPPLAAPYKWLYILNLVRVWNACGQTCHKNIRPETNTCNHFPLKTSAEIICIRVDCLQNWIPHKWTRFIHCFSSWQNVHTRVAFNWPYVRPLLHRYWRGLTSADMDTYRALLGDILLHNIFQF